MHPPVEGLNLAGLMQTIMQRAIRQVDARRGGRAHGKELVHLTGLEGRCQGGTGTSPPVLVATMQRSPGLSYPAVYFRFHRGGDSFLRS